MYISVKKAKLYPNKDTQELLNKTFGCCRFVYNHLLAGSVRDYTLWKFYAIQDSLYPKPKLDYYSLAAKLPNLKQEFPFLTEVSSVALQRSVNDLAIAYQNFFRTGKGFPKFKNKHSKCSFKITDRHIINIEEGGVKLPKTKHFTKFLPKYDLEDVSSYTVVKDRVGDYFINMLVKEPFLERTGVSTAVGVDLGIKSFAVVKSTNGTVKEIANNRYYTKLQSKRTKLARRLSKKQKGSNNRNKARIRLAKLERKITNCRKDFLHKESTKLIHENQVICLENLNVKGMLKNGKLAKHIQDCGWSTFVEFLEYKAKKYRLLKNILYIDRYYPSSNTCSNCGVKLEVKLKLSDRHWTCPVCSSKHDRDENAAFNILKQGLLLV